jgi:spore germination cell wall hydrolase CwlJ-like protein
LLDYRICRGRLAPLAFVCLLFSSLGTLPATARDPDFAAYSKDLKCLATAIYFEARGESELGQEAVAQVILNRERSNRYPDTVCAVVYQNAEQRNRCQFSFACDGKPDVPKEVAAWRKATRIAAEALRHPTRIWALASATLYHADYVDPAWAPKVTLVSSIGRHLFYKEPGVKVGDKA